MQIRIRGWLMRGALLYVAVWAGFYVFSGKALLPTPAPLREVTAPMLVETASALHLLSPETAPTALKAANTVLIYTHASWCAVCASQWQIFRSQKLPEGMKLRAISLDTKPEQALRYAAAANLKALAELYWLPEAGYLSFRHALKASGCQPNAAVPSFYLLDAQGRCTWQHVGVLSETKLKALSALRAKNQL